MRTATPVCNLGEDEGEDEDDVEEKNTKKQHIGACIAASP
jgi:hypothetical protein